MLVPSKRVKTFISDKIIMIGLLLMKTPLFISDVSADYVLSYQQPFAFLIELIITLTFQMLQHVPFSIQNQL